MTKDELNKRFIRSCVETFKLYDHIVTISRNRSELWHFKTMYNRKQYYVYCAPEFHKVKALVKIALRKVPEGIRFVVISGEHDEVDEQTAAENEYCLVDIDKLQKYGNDMLEAKAREVDDNSKKKVLF